MTEATRILVVDDDPKIRTVVRRGLAYEGYRVVEAASGEEALERAREHLPDLVVLDLMLPGIDGLEVTRRLRAAGDEVAILMLTARDQVQDRVEGLETGGDDYLVKPSSFEELLARCHALLRRRVTSQGEVLRGHGEVAEGHAAGHEAQKGRLGMASPGEVLAAALVTTGILAVAVVVVSRLGSLG